MKTLVVLLFLAAILGRTHGHPVTSETEDNPAQDDINWNDVPQELMEKLNGFTGNLTELKVIVMETFPTESNDSIGVKIVNFVENQMINRPVLRNEDGTKQTTWQSIQMANTLL